MNNNHHRGCFYFFWLRFNAIFILVSFIFTNHFLPPAFAITSASHIDGIDSSKSLPSDLTTIQIPDQIGKIQETFKGKKDEVVILIQDAHAIPDAQRNIQRLINHFQNEYGLKLVTLEGAASRLDAQIFKSFPDKKALEKVLGEYHQRGELAGGVAATILNESKGIYQGIEDWKLYEEGLGLYLQASEQESTISNKISNLEKSLQEKKSKVYSKKLLELDQILDDFYKNSSTLLDVLIKLSEIKQPEKDSELALLIEEAKRHPEETQTIEIEVKRIAEKIRSSLRGGRTRSLVAVIASPKGAKQSTGSGQAPQSKSEIASTLPVTLSRNDESVRAFNQKYQEFQTSKIQPQAFAFFLKEIASEHSLPIEVSNQLVHLIKNQKRLQNIQGTQFFEDFEQYVQETKDVIFKTDEEKALDQKTQQLRLLERFIRLELSHEDWERIKNLIPSLRSNPGDRFVAALLAMTNELKSHFAFYEIAAGRDIAFLKNLQKLMQNENGRTAIVVSGGFHTEGLTEQLKNQGISYVVLIPQMDSIPEHTNYRAHMHGDVSWKNYFEAENGRVNLYNAFVRGTRDRLLDSSKSNKGMLLKFWRDQIIRDLAAKEEIVKAQHYTRFIDEVAGGNLQDKWHNKWLANIDRFIAGLNRLETRGLLNEQNVLKLLKPSTSTWITAAAGTAVGAPEASIAAPFYLKDVKGSDDAALKLSTGETPGVPSAPNVPSRRAEVRVSSLGRPSDSEDNVYIEIDQFILGKMKPDARKTFVERLKSDDNLRRQIIKRRQEEFTKEEVSISEHASELAAQGVHEIENGNQFFPGHRFIAGKENEAWIIESRKESYSKAVKIYNELLSLGELEDIAIENIKIAEGNAEKGNQASRYYGAPREHSAASAIEHFENVILNPDYKPFLKEGQPVPVDAVPLRFKKDTLPVDQLLKLDFSKIANARRLIRRLPDFVDRNKSARAPEEYAVKYLLNETQLTSIMKEHANLFVTALKEAIGESFGGENIYKQVLKKTIAMRFLLDAFLEIRDTEILNYVDRKVRLLLELNERKELTDNGYDELDSYFGLLSLYSNKDRTIWNLFRALLISQWEKGIFGLHTDRHVDYEVKKYSFLGEYEFQNFFANLAVYLKEDSELLSHLQRLTTDTNIAVATRAMWALKYARPEQAYPTLLTILLEQEKRYAEAGSGLDINSFYDYNANISEETKNQFRDASYRASTAMEVISSFPAEFLSQHPEIKQTAKRVLERAILPINERTSYGLLREASKKIMRMVDPEVGAKYLIRKLVTDPYPSFETNYFTLPQMRESNAHLADISYIQEKNLEYALHKGWLRHPKGLDESWWGLTPKGIEEVKKDINVENSDRAISLHEISIQSLEQKPIRISDIVQNTVSNLESKGLNSVNIVQIVQGEATYPVHYKAKKNTIQLDPALGEIKVFYILHSKSRSEARAQLERADMNLRSDDQFAYVIFEVGKRRYRFPESRLIPLLRTNERDSIGLEEEINGQWTRINVSERPKYLHFVLDAVNVAAGILVFVGELNLSKSDPRGILPQQTSLLRVGVKYKGNQGLRIVDPSGTNFYILSSKGKIEVMQGQSRRSFSAIDVPSTVKQTLRLFAFLPIILEPKLNPAKQENRLSLYQKGFMEAIRLAATVPRAEVREVSHQFNLTIEAEGDFTILNIDQVKYRFRHDDYNQIKGEDTTVKVENIIEGRVTELKDESSKRFFIELFNYADQLLRETGWPPGEKPVLRILVEFHDQGIRIVEPFGRMVLIRYEDGAIEKFPPLLPSVGQPPVLNNNEIMRFAFMPDVLDESTSQQALAVYYYGRNYPDVMAFLSRYRAETRANHEAPDFLNIVQAITDETPIGQRDATRGDYASTFLNKMHLDERINDKEVQALIEHLKSKNSKVQNRVLLALAGVSRKSDETLQAVLPLLSNSETAERAGEVFDSLEEPFDLPSAVEWIKGELQKDKPLMNVVRQVLEGTKITEDKDINPIVSGLAGNFNKIRDHHQVEETLDVLSRFGQKASPAIPAILEYYIQAAPDDTSVAAVMRALVEIDPSNEQVVMFFTERLRESRKPLRYNRDNLLDSLSKAINSGKMTPAQVVALVPIAMDNLEEVLNVTENENEQREFAEFLKDIKSNAKSILPRLIELFKNKKAESNDDVRQSLISVLGATGDASNDQVIAILKQQTAFVGLNKYEPDFPAVAVLAELQSQKSAEVLLEIIQEELGKPNPEFHTFIVRNAAGLAAKALVEQKRKFRKIFAQLSKLAKVSNNESLMKLVNERPLKKRDPSQEASSAVDTLLTANVASPEFTSALMFFSGFEDYLNKEKFDFSRLQTQTNQDILIPKLLQVLSQDSKDDSKDFDARDHYGALKLLEIIGAAAALPALGAQLLKKQVYPSGLPGDAERDSVRRHKAAKAIGRISQEAAEVAVKDFVFSPTDPEQIEWRRGEVFRILEEIGPLGARVSMPYLQLLLLSDHLPRWLNFRSFLSDEQKQFLADLEKRIALPDYKREERRKSTLRSIVFGESRSRSEARVDENATKSLIQQLRTTEHEFNRQTAAFDLAQKKFNQTERQILEAALPDLVEALGDIPNVAEWVLEILKQVGSAAIAPLKEKVLSVEASEVSRLNALQALTEIDPDVNNLVFLLIGLLNDKDPSIRDRSVYHLGSFGPAAGSAVQPLLGILKNAFDENDMRMLGRAYEALKRILPASEIQNQFNQSGLDAVEVQKRLEEDSILFRLRNKRSGPASRSEARMSSKTVGIGRSSVANLEEAKQAVLEEIDILAPYPDLKKILAADPIRLIDWLIQDLEKARDGFGVIAQGLIGLDIQFWQNARRFFSDVPDDQRKVTEEPSLITPQQARQMVSDLMDLHNEKFISETQFVGDPITFIDGFLRVLDANNQSSKRLLIQNFLDLYKEYLTQARKLLLTVSLEERKITRPGQEAKRARAEVRATIKNLEDFLQVLRSQSIITFNEEVQIRQNARAFFQSSKAEKTLTIKVLEAGTEISKSSNLKEHLQYFISRESRAVSEEKPEQAGRKVPAWMKWTGFGAAGTLLFAIGVYIGIRENPFGIGQKQQDQPAQVASVAKQEQPAPKMEKQEEAPSKVEPSKDVPKQVAPTPEKEKPQPKKEIEPEAASITQADYDRVANTGDVKAVKAYIKRFYRIKNEGGLSGFAPHYTKLVEGVSNPEPGKHFGEFPRPVEDLIKELDNADWAEPLKKPAPKQKAPAPKMEKQEEAPSKVETPKIAPKSAVELAKSIPVKDISFNKLRKNYETVAETGDVNAVKAFIRRIADIKGEGQLSGFVPHYTKFVEGVSNPEPGKHYGAFPRPLSGLLRELDNSSWAKVHKNTPRSEMRARPLIKFVTVSGIGAAILASGIFVGSLFKPEQIVGPEKLFAIAEKEQEPIKERAPPVKPVQPEPRAKEPVVPKEIPREPKEVAPKIKYEVSLDTIRFFQKRIAGISNYIDPKVGLHGPTGAPRDNVRLDAKGEVVAVGDYGAPSKDGVYLPTLVLIYQQNPITSQIKISPDQALDLLLRNLKSLRQFQKDYEGKEVYGGLFPWYELRADGTRRLTQYGGRRMVPSLDNGQTTLGGLVAIAGAFWDAPQGSKERQVHDLALELLKNQDYKKWVNPRTGRLYAEWSFDQSRGVPGGAEVLFWTEWAIPALYAYLNGDMTQEGWLSQSNQTFVWDSPAGELDMPQMYRFSAPEHWIIQYLGKTIMKSKLAPLYLNTVYARAQWAKDNNIPGFSGVEYRADGTYASSGPRLKGLKILGPIEDDQMATPYGTGLDMIIHPPAADWMRYLLEQPGMETKYGFPTSFTRTYGASKFFTGDNFTTLNALAEWYDLLYDPPGGINDSIIDYFAKSKGITQEQAEQQIIAAFDLHAEAILKRLGRDQFLTIDPAKIPSPPEKRDYTVKKETEKTIDEKTISVSSRLQDGHWHSESAVWNKSALRSGDIVANYNMVGKDYSFVGTYLKPGFPVAAMDKAGKSVAYQSISFWVPADLKGEEWQLEFKNGNREIASRIPVKTSSEGLLSKDGKWKRIVVGFDPNDAAIDEKLPATYIAVSTNITITEGRKAGKFYLKDIQLHLEPQDVIEKERPEGPSKVVVPRSELRTTDRYLEEYRALVQASDVRVREEETVQELRRRPEVRNVGGKKQDERQRAGVNEYVSSSNVQLNTGLQTPREAQLSQSKGSQPSFVPPLIGFGGQKHTAEINSTTSPAPITSLALPEKGPNHTDTIAAPKPISDNLNNVWDSAFRLGGSNNSMPANVAPDFQSVNKNHIKYEEKSSILILRAEVRSSLREKVNVWKVFFSPSVIVFGSSLAYYSFQGETLPRALLASSVVTAGYFFGVGTVLLNLERKKNGRAEMRSEVGSLGDQNIDFKLAWQWARDLRILPKEKLFGTIEKTFSNDPDLAENTILRLASKLNHKELSFFTLNIEEDGQVFYKINHPATSQEIFRQSAEALIEIVNGLPEPYGSKLNDKEEIQQLKQSLLVQDSVAQDSIVQDSDLSSKYLSTEEMWARLTPQEAEEAQKAAEEWREAFYSAIVKAVNLLSPLRQIYLTKLRLRNIESDNLKVFGQ